MKNKKWLMAAVLLPAVVFILSCGGGSGGALQKDITELQKLIDENGDKDTILKASEAITETVKNVSTDNFVKIIKDASPLAQYYAMLGATPEMIEHLRSETVSPASDFLYQAVNENKEIRISGYSGNKGIVVIPATIEDLPVTQIGEGAFSGNIHTINASKAWQIVLLGIPDTVRTIGPNAFAYLNKLVSINIPANLYSISHYAFQGCSALTDISIPESVTEVKFYHFLDRWVNFMGQRTNFGEWLERPNNGAFEGCQKLPIKTRSKIQGWGYTGNF